MSLDLLIASMVGNALVPPPPPPPAGQSGWNEGYVSTSGSSGNNGSDYNSPLATPTQAYNAGFRTIHVGAGTYDFPANSEFVTYVFYPGTTTVANGPVPSSGGVSLLGYSPVPEHRYRDNAACILSASGNPTSAFYVTGGEAHIRDLVVRAKSWSQAALKTLNVSGSARRCKNVHGASTEWVDSFVARAEATTTPIDWIVDNNWGPRCPIFMMDSNNQVGRFSFTNNYNFGGGLLGDGTWTPNLYVQGVNVGSYIGNNSMETRRWEGNPPHQSNAEGVVVMEGETRNLTFIGNGQERIGTGGHDYVFHNVSSSFFYHSKGPFSHFGDLEINGSFRTVTDWQDNRKNVIIVTGTYNA